MLKKSSIIILFLFAFLQAKSSHIVGGEISYVCLGGSTYEITFRFYQDCLPPSQGGGNPAALEQDNPAFISIFNGNNFYDFDSVFASEILFVPINFSNECINNIPNTCIRRLTFKLIKNLPPSSQPYTIINARCCRNETINNVINPGQVGGTYTCTIPPSPIVCNNSARFSNYPPQIICINNPFYYDHSAIDADGDSLSYEFCTAYDGGDPTAPKPIISSFPGLFSIPYRSPFTAANPMSGNPALVIDPVSGIMTGTPNMQGRFIVNVCCHEWRNGVKINTVSREFQFVVTNCSKAVVANIPQLSSEPNTYIVQCKDFTVSFLNTSTGGFRYKWDFGVEGVTTDTSSLVQPTYTYPDTGTYVVKLLVNEGSTCPDSITRFVKVYPSFDADFVYSGLLCPDNPINFTDQSVTQYGVVNFWQWNFADGNVSSLQNPSHSYGNVFNEYPVQLISGSSFGCRDTVTKILTIPFVKVFAGNDTVILKNESINFQGTGAANYFWSPPDYLSNVNISNPVGFYPDTGRFSYILQGITADGCIGFDTIHVTVAKDPYFILPTVFSPNGDGLNDIFKVLAAGFRKLNSFKIFDRWGKMVFSTTDIKTGWDGRYLGRLCDIGTYFWIANAIDLAGRPRVVKGDITIVH